MKNYDTGKMTYYPLNIQWYFDKMIDTGVRVSFISWQHSKNICMWKKDQAEVHSKLIKKYNESL